MLIDPTSAPLSRREAHPIVVDLDGTLCRSDLLLDSILHVVGVKPRLLPAAIAALRQGKAAFKEFIAENAPVEPRWLPYNPAVLAHIAEARSSGRPIYLATAAHRSSAEAVAQHLGLFEGVIATTDVNLTGEAKAALLADRFGERGFDYIGGGRADTPVWAVADQSFSVAAPPLRHRDDSTRAPTYLGGEQPGKIRAWLAALRMPQYAKNILVFVAMLTSHTFTAPALLNCVLAFLAFCCAASAVYVANDALDVNADRQHSRKRNRPFASGALPLWQAPVATLLLLAAAIAIATSVSPAFTAVLLAYVGLSTIYSLYLKRKLLLDVITLALLYSSRVFAGAAAIGVAVSEWLMMFCLFVFSALALIKRYVELAERIDSGLGELEKRNYRKADLPIVGALAAANAMCAVLVFALYLFSPAVADHYARPHVLWLSCPLLMYLLARMLIKAHRREMHDDPVIFVLRDGVSRIGMAVFVVLVLGAI